MTDAPALFLGSYDYDHEGTDPLLVALTAEEAKSALHDQEVARWSAGTAVDITWSAADRGRWLGHATITGEHITTDADFLIEPIALAGTGAEHHVDFEGHRGGFAIQHALSCRPNLLDCPMQHALASLSRCPVEEPGRYLVTLDDDGRPVVGERV